MNRSMFPFDVDNLAKFYGVDSNIIIEFWDLFFYWRDRLIITNSPNIYEENFLILLSLFASNGNYIEIGIDEGATFKMMIDVRTRLNLNKSLFGIDISAEKFSTEIGSLIYWNTDSANINNMVNEFGGVGCIFIDGDHSYDGCARDTLNAINIINDGGFICYHDTSSENGNEGVRKMIAGFKLRTRWKYVEAHFKHGVTVFKVNKKNMVGAKKNDK